MAEMDSIDRLLLIEFEQYNEYARSNFTLLVSWFTFFNTVNYIAIGWFINQLVEGKVKSLVPVSAITIFFIGNNVLAVGACKAVRKYFAETDKEIIEILWTLEKMLANDVSVKPSSPVPLSMYARIIQLMMYTFCTLGLFWVTILIAAIYVTRL
jgi:hypothetical protein